ncbi:archaeal heat shock protein Hsp20 [Candidatus Nitrosocosmicus sp. T]
MNNKNILPYDWFSNFFNPLNSRGLIDRSEVFRDFEDRHRGMDAMLNVFNDISTNAPEELVREYETEEGVKVREVGPIVYGYSMTIGPDGKPQVREFGNVRSLGEIGGIVKKIGQNIGKSSQISAEREPLVDVNTTDTEVKVVVEMPGIRKEDIKINTYDSQLEIATSKDAQRKYHKNIELPEQAEIETARSVYNNGVLEVTFNVKKKEAKSKRKEIKIE